MRGDYTSYVDTRLERKLRNISSNPRPHLGEHDSLFHNLTRRKDVDAVQEKAAPMVAVHELAEMQEEIVAHLKYLRESFTETYPLGCRTLEAWQKDAERLLQKIRGAETCYWDFLDGR